MPSDEISSVGQGAVAARTFASGAGWSVREYICRAGPTDRPFEERHEGFSLSAVIEGAFSYRSDTGRGWLHPGAFLLGNSGRCFECGHDHGIGDRCISVNVCEELFEEIASQAASSSRFRFSTPNLPPSRRMLLPIVELEALARDAAPMRGEEVAMRAVECVVAAAAGTRNSPAEPNAREAKRVLEAVNHIEADVSRAMQLQDLAAIAGLSKYHFLRVFRRLIGVTPYQYLLNARLRRAALALASTGESVLAIALDCGFGDLSTFNHRFRETFGAPPTQFRALRRRRRNS